jgi:hypothetical protein
MVDWHSLPGDFQKDTTIMIGFSKKMSTRHFSIRPASLGKDGIWALFNFSLDKGQVLAFNNTHTKPPCPDFWGMAPRTMKIGPAEGNLESYFRTKYLWIENDGSQFLQF